MMITFYTDIDKIEDMEKVLYALRQIKLKEKQTISTADLPDMGQDSLDHLHVGKNLPELTTLNPEMDSSGLPHDERIHSVPAKLNADGKWRRRKNIPDGEFIRVEAELRGTPVAKLEQQAWINSSEDNKAFFDVDVGHTVPLPPPAPQVVMPPPPPDLSAFTKMMLYITPLMETSGQGGTLKVSDLEGFAKSLGCTVGNKGQVGKLQEHPELIPEFLNLVNNHVNNIAPIARG